jgi:hypothetical protein
MMMLERNSDDIVRFINNWLQTNVIQPDAAAATQQSAR